MIPEAPLASDMVASFHSPEILARHPEGLQSVSRALELLCCFSPDQPEWGVTEISEYLGLCKSAVHRILVTFEQHGFVTRTSARHYRLGLRALELGNVYRFDRRLLLKAEPLLRSLAEATDSVAHLAEMDGRDVLELMRSSGPRAVMFRRTPAFRMPVHATALGKVLLAAEGNEAFDRVVGRSITLRRYTPYTITKPDRLKLALAEVAANGYAVSDQECAVGCRCVAVPVRSASRKVVAALSISNTRETFSEANFPRLLGCLFSTAAAISRDVGSSQ